MQSDWKTPPIMYITPYLVEEEWSLTQPSFQSIQLFQQQGEEIGYLRKVNEQNLRFEGC